MNKFIITEEEKNIILNLHIEKTKRHYLNDRKTNYINYLNEASESSLSLLKNPNNKISLKNLPTTGSKVKLIGTVNGKPEELLYDVKIIYRGDAYGVNIKSMVKGASDTIADIQPINPGFFVKTALATVRATQNKQSASPYEGFTRFWIPRQEIDKTLTQLKNTGGKEATIEPGFGVKLLLTLAS